MSRSVFLPADILLPDGVDLEAWSVVACDQFTSEPEYWERVRKRTEGIPSTFHMILPEAWLNEAPAVSMAEAADEAMERYLSGSLLKCLPQSYIYVERQISTGGIRRGLVGRLDLEQYEFLRG
ncbi:MAG: DUF1015 family protein, partial [bacterium]